MRVLVTRVKRLEPTGAMRTPNNANPAAAMMHGIHNHAPR
jgi:hypothetical protein